MNEAPPADQTVQRQYDFDVRGESVRVTTGTVKNIDGYSLVAAEFDAGSHQYVNQRRSRLQQRGDGWRIPSLAEVLWRKNIFDSPEEAIRTWVEEAF